MIYAIGRDNLIRQVLEQYRKELEEEELQNKETVVQPETEIASFFGIRRTSLWRKIGKT